MNEPFLTYEQIKNECDLINARAKKIKSMQSKFTNKTTMFASKPDLIKAKARIAELERENKGLQVSLASAKAVASTKAPAKVSAPAPKPEPSVQDRAAVKAHYKTLTGEARFCFFQKNKYILTAAN